MAVPLRQMPVDWESPEAAELDPFRYGWRPKFVRLPNGELDEQRTPLTLEDLLDPQLGDVVTQSETHFDLMIVLRISSGVITPPGTTPMWRVT